MKPTLVILAAGMGSRYGGLKQIDGVGTNGEAIIEYSIYDAIQAGFGKVVFIIREDIAEAFKAHFGNKFEGKIEIDYVFQELNKLPAGLELPEQRQKPWGTGHAMLMAKDAVKEPFAIINADDFYGRDAYKVIAEFFQNKEVDSKEYCIVGYHLNKTLSDFGTVSRGVCVSSDDGYLESVTERTDIARKEGKIYFTEEGTDHELAEETLVSMNFWGFTPSVFEYTEKFFVDFFQERGQELKSEFYIPLIATRMIESGEGKLRTLSSNAQWFGVTYREDKEHVMAEIANLVETGVYPKDLWGA
ncbi:MAG: sugar phosphate nucleotidyltransferase [Bacteroidota bacterium]